MSDPNKIVSYPSYTYVHTIFILIFRKFVTTWILPDENLVKQHNNLPLIHVLKLVAVSQLQFWWLSWYSNWLFWSPTWCTGTSRCIHNFFWTFSLILRSIAEMERRKPPKNIIRNMELTQCLNKNSKPTWNFSFSPELWWKLFSNKKKIPWWTNKLIRAGT